MTGEMPMKKLSSLLNVRFLMSVVTETFWTGVAGIAVGAEYMSEQVFKSRQMTTFFIC